MYHTQNRQCLNATEPWRLSVIAVALIGVFIGCEQRDESPNTEAAEMAGAESTGGEMAGVETAGVETAGVETAGVETAGVETAGVETAGMETAGMETASMETAGMETAGMETAGVETAGVEMSVSSTLGVACDQRHSVFNDDESVNLNSEATWSCEGDVRTLQANGVPDHEVGTFPNPNNPNTISEQSVSVDFPLEPMIDHAEGVATQVVAYVLNGVKVEVGTAGTCDDAGECSARGNGGQWRMEALGTGVFNFGTDESHGHVQPFGAYHYHGIPEAYLAQLGRGESMTLVGWAVDGFPMYARYGYSDPEDVNSVIKVVSTSWRLKSMGDPQRPSLDIYPMGAFTQDYEYVAGSGDLDECNGRFGVTPEFPQGIYHYYLTEEFPFGQRCVKGTSLTGQMGPDMGGMGGMGGMMPPSCDQVPEGRPCCGDRLCDGPETPQNCPEDCE